MKGDGESSGVFCREGEEEKNETRRERGSGLYFFGIFTKSQAACTGKARKSEKYLKQKERVAV